MLNIVSVHHHHFLSLQTIFKSHYSTNKGPTEMSKNIPQEIIATNVTSNHQVNYQNHTEFFTISQIVKQIF